MKGILLIIFVLLEGIFSGNAEGQNIWKGYEHLFTPVRHYVIYQTHSPLIIDGKANESSWSKAVWSDNFMDIEGDTKPAPLYQTRTKMLWDEKNLYIFAELEEPHIWAYCNKRDQIVFHENDFEIFIDPNRDGYHYFEFEVNAQNTLFDLLLPKPYRNGGKPLISWNAKGFKSAVAIDGTLNNPSDTDKKWKVEIAIPFEALREENRNVIPKNGETWKLDFSRVNWQTVVKEGRYEKKKDAKTGRALSEYNWVWSPPGIINMHFPERWGLLQYSAIEAGKKTVSFQIPEDEIFKPYLWLVYYKQQKYRNENEVFAASLQAIDLPETFITENGKSAKLALTATDSQFRVTLTAEDGKEISLNEAGLIKKVNNEKKRFY
jgi:hypothetical protein